MLQQKAQTSYVPPTFLGWLHLARGEVDESVERFEEAVRRKDVWILNLRLNSPMPIPDDPRFDAIIRKLGIPG
jgi:hypothetical protein